MTLKLFVLTAFTVLAIARLSAQSSIPLEFNLESAHQLTVELNTQGEILFTTSGEDPFLHTKPLKVKRPVDAVVLSMDYFCPSGVDFLEVRLGSGPSYSPPRNFPNMGVAEGWVSLSFDLDDAIGSWGAIGDVMRIDFGVNKKTPIRVRNVVLRSRSDREIELVKNKKEIARVNLRLDSQIKEYLEAEFTSVVEHVAVEGESIVVTGKASNEEMYLCELLPNDHVTMLHEFENKWPVSGSFTQTIPRFFQRDGFKIDRLLSRWCLSTRQPTGQMRAVSHARFPDVIHSENSFPNALPQSKKGLGGFAAHRGHLDDLDKLEISSATVNIWISGMMVSKSSDGSRNQATVIHRYNGREYFFNEREVHQMDETLRVCAKKNIIVAGILLVGKASKTRDREIGKILQHPDCDPAGIYSMPNLTSTEGIQHYAAALDFLASRYNRPDAAFGRIHHFIMHNEVDAGWVWTNAGEKPARVFFDLYHKSMRIGHAILKSHYPHGKVFISLTHHWAKTVDPKFYTSKELLEYLIQYSQCEGDFDWALAYHPYPESLFEPKTWLDHSAKFEFDTPKITFRNLEVLDAWMKRPESLFQGKERRTVWLSENGTNSPDYSEQSLREQAAGFAYTWKKLDHLDGIDAFQWHNWMDNRHEGGLRIGLRKFHDDNDDPAGRKPVWYLYQSAGTPQEDAAFEPYLDVIGIDRWDQAVYRDPIQ